MKSEKTHKYIYNIGYYTCEGTENVQLLHEVKFTENQLRDIIHNATLKVLDKIRTGEIPKPPKYSFEMIFHNVIDELVKTYNFENIDFTASWDCFGWASLFNKNDFKYHRDESLKELTAFLKKKGYKEEEFKDYELER